MQSDKQDKQQRNGKLSLYPLSFEEALAAALEVEPPEKPERKGRAAKPAKDGRRVPRLKDQSPTK
jgi:hypothetical protein